MRVLLDSCVALGVKQHLIDAGHDVECVKDWPSDPGDQAILRQAHLDARILITLDKDFGELAIVHQQPHCGIIRLVYVRPPKQGAVCAETLDTFGEQLAASAIVTVEPFRVRVRPVESDDN